MSHGWPSRCIRSPGARGSRWSSTIFRRWPRNWEQEGVHTGQDDPPIARVREVAGFRTIIGRSTHSLAQAGVAAAHPDVDYIGFGPLFATPTKPAYAAVGMKDIRTVYEAISKPVFCIGGIKLENLAAVIEAGARRVVLVSGILKAKDIAGYCREVKGMLP